MTSTSQTPPGNDEPGKHPVTPPKGRKTRKARVRSSTIPARWLLVALAIVAGLLAEAGYALVIRPWGSIFGAAALFSFAAMVAGGLLGMLFGIPQVDTTGSGTQRTGGKPAAAAATAPATATTGAHTITTTTTVTTHASAVAAAPTASAAPALFRPAVLTPSTNLQQVADWLTKLIIGAGLVQLGRAPSSLSRLFHAMAPALGGQASSPALAGAIAIYFAGLGFVTGWLAAYFLLTPEMVRAQNAVDTLFEQSRILATKATQATQKGTTAKADQLRSASSQRLAQAQGLITAYNQAYSLPVQDPTRNQRIDHSVDELAAGDLPGATATTVKAKYTSPTPVDKAVALAVMAARPDLADLDDVVASIMTPGSGVEQYQALRAASVLVGQPQGLDPAQSARLQTAIEAAMAPTGNLVGSTERRRLALDILRRMAPPEPPAAAPPPAAPPAPAPPPPAP